MFLKQHVHHLGNTLETKKLQPFANIYDSSRQTPRINSIWVRSLRRGDTRFISEFKVPLKHRDLYVRYARQCSQVQIQLVIPIKPFPCILRRAQRYNASLRSRCNTTTYSRNEITRGRCSLGVQPADMVVGYSIFS